MKKISVPEYRALFYRHVWQFLEKILKVQELKSPVLLGVSGGVDSMMLLQMAFKFQQLGKIGPIRVAFVHHHTRLGQDADGELVKKRCLELGLEFVELHAKGLGEIKGNFEAQARKERRNLLNAELRANEFLWLAHHLDDSYEWSLLQKYRSSHPKTSLGIPVRNKKIIRPFMCVSKKQIQRMAQMEDVPFREDPTNQDARFERNYLRSEMVPVIEKRFPKYLKHYVGYSNKLAELLGMSLSRRIAGAQVHLYHNGAVMIGKQFRSDEVMDVLKQYSNTNRGEWSDQLQKMFKAIDNGKKGPFHFSGGTEIYYTNNLLMIYRQKFQNADVEISQSLALINFESLAEQLNYSFEELQLSWKKFLASSEAMSAMPGLVLLVEDESRVKTLNGSSYDSLFPEVSSLCQKQGWKFVSAQKLLKTWETKREKLPRNLRILPLWHLSHLFTSQA